MTTEQLFLTNRGKFLTWHKIRSNLGGVSFRTAHSSVQHFKRLHPDIHIKIEMMRGVRISSDIDINNLLTSGYSERPNAYGSVFNR